MITKLKGHIKCSQVTLASPAHLDPSVPLVKTDLKVNGVSQESPDNP